MDPQILAFVEAPLGGVPWGELEGKEASAKW